MAGAVLKAVLKLEGGAKFSVSARRLMARAYEVYVEAYSSTGMFAPGSMARGTSIGRYSSIARGASTLTRNHPLDGLSTSSCFYSPEFGVVTKELLPPPGRLRIGHDVWIGRGAMIMPGCSRIATGAVVAAGAIVTKDVEEYMVVGGNPAKPIKRRLPDAVAEMLLACRWWECSPEQLRRLPPEFFGPLTAIEPTRIADVLNALRD